MDDAADALVCLLDAGADGTLVTPWVVFHQLLALEVCIFAASGFCVLVKESASNGLVKERDVVGVVCTKGVETRVLGWVVDASRDNTESLHVELCGLLGAATGSLEGVVSDSLIRLLEVCGEAGGEVTTV